MPLMAFFVPLDGAAACAAASEDKPTRLPTVRKAIAMRRMIKAPFLMFV
jgi:hypothetical protein